MGVVAFPYRLCGFRLLDSPLWAPVSLSNKSFVGPLRGLDRDHPSVWSLPSVQL